MRKGVGAPIGRVAGRAADGTRDGAAVGNAAADALAEQAITIYQPTEADMQAWGYTNKLARRIQERIGQAVAVAMSDKYGLPPPPQAPA